ncbi:helix-turn-helix transcriptional regulator [Limimaricola sp.]|uniref:helix-turn-helix transcriptional regulator n=1 Tax=Limimaricola sp. TaxID=2211665 RepID=UPI004059BC88
MFGSEFCFSDDLLKAFDTEFDNVDFLRTEALSDITRFRDTHGNVQLILVDARYVTTPAEARSAAAAAGTDMLALVYAGRAPDRALLLEALHSHGVPRLGLLPLNARIDVLLAMLRLLICGEILVPEDVLRALIGAGITGASRPTDETADAAMHDLTRREWEVLSLIAEGKQNKIVAAELGLSEHTVKLHIHHLIRKLGVSNRTGAAIWYLGQGEATAPLSDPP